MLSPSLKNKTENNLNFEEQKVLEMNKLSPYEPDWFTVLTDSGFIIRLFLVAIVMIYCGIVIINVSMDNNSKSWFNKLHKPDWGPDGIVIVIIFAFLSILLAWIWYRFSKLSHSYIYEAVVLICLALFVLWTVFLFQDHNITVAKYLICGFLGFMVVLMLLSFWKFGFSDVALYTFIYVAWLVVLVFYTFDLHELDKEYKLLSIVTDKSSSLYKKKMKMEIVEGIKITEEGEKIEFDPNDQE